MSGLVNLLPLFVVVPLGGAFLTTIIGRRVKRLPDLVGVIATFCLFCFSVWAVAIVKQHGVLVYSVGAWRPPVGITLVLDALTSFMLVTVNTVVFLIAVYSVRYMEHFTSKWKFFTLFLLLVGGMNGVIITGDLFNLFVFLEIAAVASYALVAFGTEKYELEAAFKYGVMSSVSSLFILLGIAFLYAYTSTLNMADMAAVLSKKGPNEIIPMVSILFIMGFGLKAALVPFHAWLPDAHPSAPAPISATLSGVLIKSLGAYTICRIFFNVIGFSEGVSYVLLVLGTLSMVGGVFLAVGQWDFKRLLAYHSISQMGYVILGIGLGTPLGILGGLFHLFNHSIFKSLLFLNSGAVEYATGTRDLQRMGGLFKKMPVTGTTNLIASMSIAGIPPFNGFWSKLLIIVACVQAGRYGFAFWAVFASILTLASFMKVMKYVYYGKLPKALADTKEVPGLMKFAMVVLAFICVIGGLLFLPGVAGTFLQPATAVLLKGVGYAHLPFIP
ncbi:MAG: monovalent cation/H+ antiporter subunit D family protein [Candidatus Omnitrophota bacterium]